MIKRWAFRLRESDGNSIETIVVEILEKVVVVDKVKQGKDSFGYNAGTGEYGDMIEMGLDPAKVTRTALQAAASIAG